MPRSGITWTADTFLTASPDALMTRVVESVCGFRWGYTTLAEGPEVLPVTRADRETWSSARGVLIERYPTWEFRPRWTDRRRR